MSDSFSPILDAALAVIECAKRVPFASAYHRPASEREASERALELTRLIAKQLTLGLPPTRDGYPAGRAAWEADLRDALADLQHAANELVDAALATPIQPEYDPLHRDPAGVQRFAEAQLSAINGGILPQEARLRSAWNRIWGLVGWVKALLRPPSNPTPPPRRIDRQPGGARRRPGRKSLTRSKKPQDQLKANLYSNISSKKREWGLGGKMLLRRLQQDADILELAKSAGMEKLDLQLIKAAEEHQAHSTKSDQSTN